MLTVQRTEQDPGDSIKRLNEIGMALSVERNLTVLLERILLGARRLTCADAGTLYLVRDNHLTFEIAQNDSLEAFNGGSCSKANVPPLPINKESVAGYAALTGVALNIADVYADRQYHFEGPKHYDHLSGYRTQSMLAVPMKDHEGHIIGVMVLINSVDPVSGATRPFGVEDEALLQSLASQAAIAINNVRLIEDTERLFESFVQVMATAIDERSPCTGGHIRRVAEMTMFVAAAVNNCCEGPLAQVHFDENQLNELRIAAWMHDIGKITTPEWVLDKPTKLTTIFDRIELLRTRFALIRKSLELEKAQTQIRHLETGEALPENFETTWQQRLDEVDALGCFVERANMPGEFMEEADLQQLREIASRTYVDGGEMKNLLTEDELKHLSIPKGSLTQEERQKINDHAAISVKILTQIPFTRTLKGVPDIAGAHHEKLDGSGYPRGLKGEDISLQTCILALVDTFESLSANDRPYRASPIPREAVLRILQQEVEANHLDHDLFELFMREELYLKLEEIKAQMAAEKAMKITQA